MNNNKEIVRWGNSVRLVLTLAMLLSSIGVFAANPPAPPTNIIVFPQRDFISASGYAADDRVVVRVLHDQFAYPGATGGNTGPIPIAALSTDPALPAGADGIVEVNHPGGSCWSGQTPDIRPGDRVQVEVMAGTNAGRIDETTVRNVTAKRPVQTGPGIVQVHGTATESFTAIPGAPLPIAELEQRILAPGDLFAFNNRRTLRAISLGGADGSLSYDTVNNPNGTNWTATYSGLSAADVTLALGGESRGMWLGPTATETTVYEIGALTVGGPQAPCAAALEVLPPPPGSELVPPTAPTNLTASINNANTVTLNWTASIDPPSVPASTGVTAYGIYRGGDNIAANMQAIFTVSNSNGSAPAPITFVDRNTPPGTYFYTVRALDEVGNISAFSNVAGPVTAVQQVNVNTFPVNDPPALPINIIAFPSRDFISPSGFLPDDAVTVQLLRKNALGQTIVVSSAEGIIPIDGFAEVNHPGGACWEGVTPEIRVGDIVRTIAYNTASIVPGNPDGIRSIDQTTIAGVTAFRPVVVTPASANGNEGVVEIHGTALGADGLPIPIGQLEQRMIATHGVGLWDFNGRRALRAASAAADGTLTYDTVNNPMGINWTARYSGLDAADVARMADADTRAHWLGRNPLLLNEATIFENSNVNLPGPAGPACTRPLEAADVVAPSTPGSFTVFQSAANQVTLSWGPSADDWYVAGYRIYLDGAAVANTGPLDLSTALTVQPGSHTYAVAAFDTASPRGTGATIIDQILAGFGNLYGNLSVLSTTGSLSQPDVTAPSVPTNLVATLSDPAAPKVTLTWAASADNVAVVGYGVYRGGTLIANVTGTSFTDSGADFGSTGLPTGTYLYTVDAVDAQANRSALSAEARVNVAVEIVLDANGNPVPVFESIAPTIPGNVLATTSPDIHGRNVVVSWAASTDTGGVTGYGIYRNGSTTPIASVNGTTLSFTDANLQTGTYSYTVDAVDSPGNRSAKSVASTAVVANDPPVAPHSLIAFPARDFISGTGFTPGANYHFTHIRGGTVINSGSQAADATGLIEVNHPGGTCWNVNTPNIRPGDVVRITDDATGIADQTTVANVTAERPVAIIRQSGNTVVINGTAQDAIGNPLPVGQIQQRLISSTATSFSNGRRALVTGVDGTLAYDTANNPTGTKWTATYAGLTDNDVLIAVGGTSPTGTVFVGAESRAHWLGRAPLALTEATIFENGPGVVGGPSAPCTAPAETPVAAASMTPTRVSFPDTQFSPTVLSSAPLTVTFSNGGGAPMTITNIYFAGLNPDDFALANVAAGGPGTCPTAFPASLAAGASCTVRVTFTPGALGLRQANISFSDNAANTTDQAVALTGSGSAATAPIINVSATSLAFGTVNGGASSNQTLTVSNTGTGSALSISALSFTGTAAADFTRTGGTCSTTFPISVAAGSNCTVSVTFKPGARGARAATLTLSHNAAPTATSTAIALSGTGGNGSVLSFASNPVKFGTVNRGATQNQTVSVKNSGNAAATLSLASFTVTGTGYSLISTTCATLAVNSSCNVIVRFTAPNTVATFNGTLSVTAANGLPTTVTTNLTATTK